MDTASFLKAPTTPLTGDDDAPSVAWFALQTLYRQELRTLRDLAAKNFTAYLPLLKETRQWTDRKKVIELPAFTGYVFVRYDSTTRNRCRVLETSGIVRLLPNNHRPMPIADSEIEALQLTLGSGLPCTRHLHPAVGTKVEVLRGPLAGIQGRVVRINNKYRLVIAVSSIAQAISVEVDVNDAVAIEDFSRPTFAGRGISPAATTISAGV